MQKQISSDLSVSACARALVAIDGAALARPNVHQFAPLLRGRPLSCTVAGLLLRHRGRRVDDDLLVGHRMFRVFTVAVLAIHLCCAIDR